jgi:hypothetical protein
LHSFLLSALYERGFPSRGAAGMSLWLWLDLPER